MRALNGKSWLDMYFRLAGFRAMELPHGFPNPYLRVQGKQLARIQWKYLNGVPQGQSFEDLSAKSNITNMMYIMKA